jgi:Zn-dependent M28 family amino/carboxypeptidase
VVHPLFMDITTYRARGVPVAARAISRTVALLAALALLASASGVAAQPGEGTAAGLSPAERQLTRRITVDAIKAYTMALADDAMEGRGTGQPGADKAARWLAAEFQRMGLSPLGDNGTYLQTVPYVQSVTDEASTFTVDGAPLALGTEWAPFVVPGNALRMTADLVFVGYGIVDEGLHRNDIAGRDLTGKIAVLFPDHPANVSAERWATLGQTRFETLAAAGAKAFIFIDNGRTPTPVRLLVDYLSRPRNVAAGTTPPPLPTAMPLFGLDDTAAALLFSRSGVSHKVAFALAERDDFRAIDLQRSAEIATDVRVGAVTSSNVVAVLEGSDPTLKAEAVVFSAHYDAYGIIRGRIYNGAADNALGTAEMLATARAFAKMKPRPKRSLIFLATTGEEYGLTGSRYWASHPTWPIEKVAANLNLDGIGTEIFGPVKQVIGFGAEHSSIGPMLDEVTRAYGITVMADPIPEQGVFMRSDHYSFVERGVPSLMLVGAQAGSKDAFVKAFNDWEAVYYHQPLDDVYPTWHWPGARTVADMMGLLGLRLAQQPQMPAWAATSPFKELQRGNTAPLPALK